MNTVKFILRQQTPIIHFQHYQDGATLRATEVKPKLDRYLIQYFKDRNIEYKQWLIGETSALNYQIRFQVQQPIWSDYIEYPKGPKGTFQTENGKTKTDPYPGFFGNMGLDYAQTESIKKFEYSLNVDATIISFHYDLLEILEQDGKRVLSDFFLQHNFGTRQGKGFGSFILSGGGIRSTGYQYSFVVSDTGAFRFEDSGKKFTKIFKHIDLFYRVLRAGVNLKGGGGSDKLYVKSLLFKYFQKEKIQWEKKRIKQEFFLEDRVKPNGQTIKGLKTQQEERPESEALHFGSNEQFIVRDLLGLSSEEAWYSYGATILKYEAVQKPNGAWVEKKEDAVDRFPSPVFFKPVNLSDGTTKVYIRLQDENPMLDRDFLIEKKGSKGFPLSFPAEFSLHRFFEFVCREIKIADHMEGDLECEEAGIISHCFETLKQIPQ